MPGRFIVIDTNVIVSAAVFSSYSSALALQKTLTSAIFAFSEQILQEYAETLSSNKFDKYISIEKRLDFLQKLLNDGELIKVTRFVDTSMYFERSGTDQWHKYGNK